MCKMAPAEQIRMQAPGTNPSQAEATRDAIFTEAAVVSGS